MGGRGFTSNWNSPEWALANKACEVDDSSLIDEAISMAAVENVDEIYTHIRRVSLKHNATAILKNLIERGVHYHAHVSGGRRARVERNPQASARAGLGG